MSFPESDAGHSALNRPESKRGINGEAPSEPAVNTRTVSKVQIRSITCAAAFSAPGPSFQELLEALPSNSSVAAAFQTARSTGSITPKVRLLSGRTQSSSEGRERKGQAHGNAGANIGKHAELLLKSIAPTTGHSIRAETPPATIWHSNAALAESRIVETILAFARSSVTYDRDQKNESLKSLSEAGARHLGTKGLEECCTKILALQWSTETEPEFQQEKTNVDLVCKLYETCHKRITKDFITAQCRTLTARMAIYQEAWQAGQKAIQEKLGVRFEFPSLAKSHAQRNMYRLFHALLSNGKAALGSATIDQLLKQIQEFPFHLGDWNTRQLLELLESTRKTPNPGTPGS